MVSVALLNSPFASELTTALALAVACAVLSVFVVSRRWAFIGEGISHSGFGGAGTVWIVAMLVPAVDRMPWAPYVGVVLFSLATAGAIAYFTRTGKINSDAVIGIFLAASLAWGILAEQLYLRQLHRDPAGWNVFLFGHMGDISAHFAIAAAALCVAVVGCPGSTRGRPRKRHGLDSHHRTVEHNSPAREGTSPGVLVESYSAITL